MKLLFAILIGVFCMTPALAEMPAPKKPGSTLKTPDDPGMKTPVDPGAVVEPPRTGSEEIVKVPKRVDPEIDDATPDIDRENRKKLEEKKKKTK